MSRLPEGWEEKKLKYLCQIKYGKNFSNKNLDPNGKYPVFGANAIIGQYNEYLYDESQVLISCRGANSGVINLSPEKSYITHNSLVLEKPSINKKFLFYSLKAVNKANIISGSAQPQVTIQNANELLLPVATPKIQQKIVQKLDKLMPKIRECKERLEKIPEIIKRYKQAVLNAAVTGKLTADWRGENDYVNEYYIPDEKEKLSFLFHKEIPSSWNIDNLGNCSQMILGKMLDKSKNKGSYRKYLRNINIQWFKINKIDLSEMKFEKNELDKYNLLEGDVLVCEGGHPGRCAIVSRNEQELLFQKALHRIRLYPKILPQWLTFNLKYDFDFQIIDQYYTGTTIKHLTGKLLKQYIISIPSIDEQKEIVKRVEELFNKADTIMESYKKSHSIVDKLDQSVLAKAFRGELVK